MSFAKGIPEGSQPSGSGLGPPSPPPFQAGVGPRSGLALLLMLSCSHAGDTVPLLSLACTGMCFIRTLPVGSSCLGSSPGAAVGNSDPQELRNRLTDVITPGSIALLAASRAASSPPSPLVKLVSPGLDHVTLSSPHGATSVLIPAKQTQTL